MADTLVLGGTRNLGFEAAIALLHQGHAVTILNRGVTRDDLPPEIERLRADRNDTESIRQAIGTRSFDLVLDTTTYNRQDAEQAVAIFSNRVGQYVFISSGQVYLVRENLSRPFSESDYEGPVMPAPPLNSQDYESWLYGADKRDAEEVLLRAFHESAFPVTTLRLPMVASERDHYGRIQAYVARVLDGRPLLVPEGRGLPIRHAYVADVANLIAGLVATTHGLGEAYNISWGSSMHLDEFIALMGNITGRGVETFRASRSSLDAAQLLPACSPFSGYWMSELVNEKSAVLMRDAGASYTAPESYLAKIIEDYSNRWVTRSMMPSGYEQRDRELAFFASTTST